MYLYVYAFIFINTFGCTCAGRYTYKYILTHVHINIYIYIHATDSASRTCLNFFFLLKRLILHACTTFLLHMHLLLLQELYPLPPSPTFFIIRDRQYASSAHGFYGALYSEPSSLFFQLFSAPFLQPAQTTSPWRNLPRSAFAAPSLCS